MIKKFNMFENSNFDINLLDEIQSKLGQIWGEKYKEDELFDLRFYTTEDENAYIMEIDYSIEEHPDGATLYDIEKEINSKQLMVNSIANIERELKAKYVVFYKTFQTRYILKFLFDKQVLFKNKDIQGLLNKNKSDKIIKKFNL